MIYIRVEAMPSQTVVEQDAAIGAYASCWIDTDDPAEAEATARSWLEGEGWLVVRVEDRRVVALHEPADPQDAQYIREARERGCALLLDRWPAGGEPPVG